MTNLNSSAFIDGTQNSYASKVVAESYMQIYAYAAEDFPSHPDLKKYIQEVTEWMQSVDKRLTEQMNLISTHTHNIPPHAHGSQGAQPVPLSTQPPTSSRSIRWSAVHYPVFLNTTKAIPNLSGNFITYNSTASEGSLNLIPRRAKPLSLTLIPKLSPVLQDALKL